MSERPAARLTAPPDAEAAEYRALSTPAITGLILGLASPLAMIDPLLWIVPPLGILLSLLGLRQIAHNPQGIAGRKAAICGLVLSILFGVAAPANWLGYRWLIRREARQFAAAWFGFLSHDEPHKAHQLIFRPEYRQPFDEDLWDFYRDDPRWEGQLIAYVARPPVHTLLALGENAQVRYWETVGEDCTGDDKTVVQVYAVTYQQDGQKRTFFVGLEMQRVKLDNGRANWRLVRTQDGLVPPGL